MADEEIFEQGQPGSWAVNGNDPVVFAVTRITEAGGNRIVRRQRPYRDGAKLDDTGSKEKTYTVETVWNNSIDEPGINQNPVLYPLELNRMIELCDLHETGDLVLGTRGKRRCRAESYSRVEDPGERDTARVSFTFVEDNEDNVDANSFQQPSVRATIIRATDETTFSVESTGSFSDLLASLEGAASDLQDAIAAPGEAIQDVDQKAARVIRLADNVERQFTVTDQAGRDRLNDPDSWAAVRQLRGLQDRTAQAVDEKTSSLPRVITLAFNTTRSIFDIAVELAQDPTALMNLNSRIENMLAIEAGETVRVFER